MGDHMKLNVKTILCAPCAITVHQSAAYACRLHTIARKAQKAADESKRQHKMLQQELGQLHGALNPKVTMMFVFAA